MYAGTSPTGFELLPGAVAQRPVQLPTGLLVGKPAGASAKPLNASGAPPLERLLCAFHCAPHQSTIELPAPATVVSPRTKAPRAGNAKTIAVLPVSCDGR